jgi:hypothetical protein
MTANIMDDRRRRPVLFVAFAALLSVGAALTVFFGEDALWLFSKKTDAEFSVTREVVKNPFMGFAARRQAGNVGDNTLVYIDITFRELEPEEGVFAFEQIEEDNTHRLVEESGESMPYCGLCAIFQGRKATLTFPTGCMKNTNRAGSYYDHSSGKGFSPDYANLFIESHAQGGARTGGTLGGDKFVAYVQLGSWAIGGMAC